MTPHDKAMEASNKIIPYDYRIFVKIKGSEALYQIHEVYYNDNGKPIGYSNPAQLVTNSKKDLSHRANLLKEAFDKPILFYGKKFPNTYAQ